jgi:hypothetical protein
MTTIAKTNGAFFTGIVFVCGALLFLMRSAKNLFSAPAQVRAVRIPSKASTDVLPSAVLIARTNDSAVEKTPDLVEQAKRRWAIASQKGADVIVQKTVAGKTVRVYVCKDARVMGLVTFNAARVRTGELCPFTPELARERGLHYSPEDAVKVVHKGSGVAVAIAKNAESCEPDAPEVPGSGGMLPVDGLQKAAAPPSVAVAADSDALVTEQTGEFWEGEFCALKHATLPDRSKNDGSRYKTIRLIVKLREGIVISKYGVDLERAVAESGAAVGDWIRLGFHAKQAVTVEENGTQREKKKNLYSVQVMRRGNKALVV